MLEAAPDPRRARRVFAAPDDLVLRLHERAAAEGTGRRHLPLRRVAFALLEHRSEHFRNDVAAFFDADVVALPDVAPRDLLLVVERRHLHHGAAQADRLEHRERRDGAGPADVRLDLLISLRDGLFGGKLEGDGPSRELRGRAELPPKRQIVELDRRRRRFRTRARGARRASAGRTPRGHRARRTVLQFGSTGHSPGLQLAKRLAVGRDRQTCHSGGHDDLIRVRAEAAPGDRARNRAFEARRPPRSAGWRTRGSPACSRSSFIFRNTDAGQIDLAANLDPVRRRARERRRNRFGSTRTLEVTFSPRIPSPRVTPRTSRPRS